MDSFSWQSVQAWAQDRFRNGSLALAVISPPLIPSTIKPSHFFVHFLLRAQWAMATTMDVKSIMWGGNSSNSQQVWLFLLLSKSICNERVCCCFCFYGSRLFVVVVLIYIPEQKQTGRELSICCCGIVELGFAMLARQSHVLVSRGICCITRRRIQAHSHPKRSSFALLSGRPGVAASSSSGSFLGRCCPGIEVVAPLTRSGFRSFKATRMAGEMDGDRHESSAASSHKHTNRLAKEHSPYLLQHAHNPVCKLI